MWTEFEMKQVEGLLTQFNGSEEVCAVMGCAPGELDGLCMDAFGVGFGEARDRHRAIGRAMLRRQQFCAAMDGDRSMLQTLGRYYLGQDPVESRKDTAKAEEAAHDVPDNVLELVRARRQRRVAGA